jgi:transposase
VDPRVVELEVENAVLRRDIAELREQLKVVMGRVADLEKQLGRNSSNSSKPPSSDSGTSKTVRPENASRAARRAMARRQGKQPGTPGVTLVQVTEPDGVVTHRPVRCRSCDRSLDDAALVGVVTRQVFDVPDPRVIVIEHQAEKRRCACGCETTGAFPSEATAPAVYGPGIKAHAIYLMCAQHLPRERCALALHDLFGVNVSTGTLDNWMADAAGRLDPFLAAVTNKLQAEPFVHADETSVRSGKTALWVHVTSTRLWTMLHVGRRDRATVEAGPLGTYQGTIVHDTLYVNLFLEFWFLGRW